MTKRPRHYMPGWQKTTWAGGRGVGWLKGGGFLKFLRSKEALVRTPRPMLSHNRDHYDNEVRRQKLFWVEFDDSGERWESDIRDWELHKFGPFNLGTDPHYGLDWPTYWRKVKEGIEQGTLLGKEGLNGQKKAGSQAG